VGFVATVSFDTVTFVARDISVDTLAIPPVPAINGNITVLNELTHQLSLTGGATFALPAAPEWRLSHFVVARNYLRIGDPVTITHVVNGNGIKIAITVRSLDKEQRFTGRLTSVNTATGQIVVGGQIFVVDPEAIIFVFNANAVGLQSLQDLANENAVRPLTITVRYFPRPAGKIVVKI
jgi:hypothetical protein